MNLDNEEELKKIHKDNIKNIMKKNNALKINSNNYMDKDLEINDKDIENIAQKFTKEQNTKTEELVENKEKEEVKEINKELEMNQEETFNFNYYNTNIQTYNNNYLANVNLLSSNAVNFDGIKNITIDLLSIKDEKVLNTATTQEDYYNILYSIIQSKVKDVNFYEILAMDFETILLNLRVKSCGSIVNLKYTCNKCNTTNSISYDLSNLEYVELDKNYKEPFIVKVPIGDNEFKVLKLRLPRIKHRKLMNINENIINSTDKKVDFLSVCCLDDGTKQLETLFKEYEELPLICKRYIAKFLERFSYGYSTYIKNKCIKCNTNSMVLLPLFTREFFTKSEISDESFNEAVSM